MANTPSSSSGKISPYKISSNALVGLDKNMQDLIQHHLGDAPIVDRSSEAKKQLAKLAERANSQTTRN